MARIPQNPGPSLARMERPAIRSDARAFFPAQGGQLVGRSIARAGTVLGDFAVARVEAERKVQLADLEIEAGASLRRLHGELDRSAQWDGQEEAFATGANELRDTLAERITDPRVRQAFAQSFARQVGTIAPEVTSSAFRKQKDQALATLEAQLPELANAAAAAPTGLARETAIGQAVSTVRARFTAGFLTARDAGEQIRKLRGLVDEADVRTLIAGAPEVAVASLTDPERFPNIDPARRATFLDQALRRDEANRAESVRLAEKREREAAAARELRADEMMKGILAADANGVLTRDLIEAARPDLPSTQYRVALSLLQEKGSRQDDPATVIRIRNLLDGGETASAREEADLALSAGKITRESWGQFRTGASARPAGSAPPPAYDRAKGYITRMLDLGPLMATMESGQRTAEAIEELNRYFDENPAATAEAAQDRARDIVRRSMDQKLADTSNLMPLEPPGYAGIRAETGDDAAALDAKLGRIDALQAEIVAEYRAGRISEIEFGRRAEEAGKFRARAEAARRVFDQPPPKGGKR